MAGSPVHRRAMAIAALLAALVATPALAIEREEARSQVAERFGVEVLKVEAGQLDGRAVWLVTVMNPGSDSNSAFLVSTIALDRASGEPLRGFERIETGSLPGSRAPAAGVRPTGTPPSARPEAEVR